MDVVVFGTQDLDLVSGPAGESVCVDLEAVGYYQCLSSAAWEVCEEIEWLEMFHDQLELVGLGDFLVFSRLDESAELSIEALSDLSASIAPSGYPVQA